jgi:hypothetical protein
VRKGLRAKLGLIECGNAGSELHFTLGIFVVLVVELRIVRFGGRLSLGFASVWLDPCGAAISVFTEAWLRTRTISAEEMPSAREI